ncbi:hypothetical protein D9611_010785 [Ephemerocybe angulata]|uniref:Uncharacterized protein n=1 Tax=Ephemerocybe angulata TaxID=980116 RepID=A0A8H5BC81_9AGAR|nr:hypothetical protein D9611_010785 [Tulosesus angulatus]
MFGIVPGLTLPPPPPGGDDFLASISRLMRPPPKEMVPNTLGIMVTYQDQVEEEIGKIDPALVGSEREDPESKIWKLFDARDKLEDVIPKLFSLQDEIEKFVPGSKDAKGKGKGKGTLKTEDVQDDDDLGDYIGQRMAEILQPDRDIVFFFGLKMEGVLPSKFLSDVFGDKLPSLSAPCSVHAGGSGSGSFPDDATAGPSGSSSTSGEDEGTPTVQSVALPSSSALPV